MVFCFKDCGIEFGVVWLWLVRKLLVCLYFMFFMGWEGYTVGIRYEFVCVCVWGGGVILGRIFFGIRRIVFFGFVLSLYAFRNGICVILVKFYMYLFY